MKIFVVWRKIDDCTLGPEKACFTEEDVLSYIESEKKKILQLQFYSLMSAQKITFNYKEMIVGVYNGL